MPPLLTPGTAPASVTTGSFWLGLALAGGAIGLSILGFSLEADPSVTSDPVLVSTGADFVSESGGVDGRRDVNIRPFHQIAMSEQNGRQVYVLQATGYGDILVIDYNTGKLLSVQEVPGKFSLPPEPMAEAIVGAS